MMRFFDDIKKSGHREERQQGASRRTHEASSTSSARAEITAELLAQWALDYLGRYASSVENLRRVLQRRVRRRAAEQTAVAGPLIEAVIARHRQAGLLDDAGYAAAKAQSLHRRGGSRPAIRARLLAAGVDRETAAAALAALAADSPDPDLAAAIAFARRRRLGPYRRGTADRERELGAFARAGFTRDIAESVLRCPDIDAAEALSRG